jgi:hypothetical protein
MRPFPPSIGIRCSRSLVPATAFGCDNESCRRCRQNRSSEGGSPGRRKPTRKPTRGDFVGRSHRDTGHSRHDYTNQWKADRKRSISAVGSTGSRDSLGKSLMFELKTKAEARAACGVLVAGGRFAAAELARARRGGREAHVTFGVLGGKAGCEWIRHSTRNQKSGYIGEATKFAG